MTRLYVEVVSGAGGGRYGGAYAAAGGGGALAAGWFDVIPNQAIPVTVGMPGASVKVNDADTSMPGGSSSFGTLVTATGGGATKFRNANNVFLPADGGVASGGQVRINGVPGALAYVQGWTEKVTVNGGIIEVEPGKPGNYVMTAPGSPGPSPGAFEWPGMEPLKGSPPWNWLATPPRATWTERRNLPKVPSGQPAKTGEGLFNSVIGGASGLAVGVYQYTGRQSEELVMPSTQGYVRVRY
ncbi:hypothetical protein D9M70_378840 [compost metagenome]